MKVRRITATLLLAISLSACGSTAADLPSSPPVTSDDVAAAFAAAWAGGDTPSACKYATGRAKERMTQGGATSLCSRSSWTAQGYWLSDQCEIHGTHGTEFTYIYRTSGPVAGADSFVTTVEGSAPFFAVTAYASGPFSKTGSICTVADRIQYSSTGVPS